MHPGLAKRVGCHLWQKDPNPTARQLLLAVMVCLAALTTGCGSGGRIAQCDEGMSCDDGLACTQGDICEDGECHGTPRTCLDDDPCTEDRCEEPSGACVNEPINADPGEPCGAELSEMVLTTDSVSESWSPVEIINGGDTLTWEVSGGVSIGPVSTDAPVFDLSSSPGGAQIRVTSTDRFDGVTSFQFDDAGITSVSNVDLLDHATTFALRDNPISEIDVSGLARVDNLTIRTTRLAAIDLSDLSTLRLLWIYGNELTDLDLGNNANLEYVKATDNQLTSAALDRILIDLDRHGKSDGEVLIANNAGRLTSAAAAAYQNLIAKNWTIDVPPPLDTSGLMTVAEWRALFDARWAEEQADCLSRSQSGGVDQEYYFLGYYIDGLISIWRATGDNAYLDLALGFISNTLDDALMAPDGYRRWQVEYALWESFYWRHVATLVRVMHENPDLRAAGDYQARYDELLAFSLEHIWNKWEDGGLGNFYRSRTHMASHWARIGMELYRITGEERYREVFDNISHGEMVGYPSNLRQQLEPHPDHPAAVIWSSIWGSSASDSIQDTSHAGAIVSFWQLAAEAGMYWTDADIAALTATLMEVIWAPELDGSYSVNVDGTGGTYPTPWGRLHEWLVLGRCDIEIQARIEEHYLDSNVSYFGVQALGIAALNAKILIDGAPAY